MLNTIKGSAQIAKGGLSKAFTLKHFQNKLYENIHSISSQLP